MPWSISSTDAGAFVRPVPVSLPLGDLVRTLGPPLRDGPNVCRQSERAAAYGALSVTLMLCLYMWQLWAILSVFSGGKLFINWLLNLLFPKEHGMLLLTEKLLFCLLVLVLQPYTGSSLLVLLKSVNSRLITSISKVTELCWEAILREAPGHENQVPDIQKEECFQRPVCWTSREGGKQVRFVISKHCVYRIGDWMEAKDTY